jgi:glycosyltransferase involved in cell wall biosynthesis
VSNLKRADRLLIIIPAYNEQGAIHHVVSGVRQAVPEADVLVINDGSIDNTAQEAEAAGALVVEHPFNLGIGGAVQTGLKFARDQGYDYVIRLDGDGQHNADEIQLFLKVLRSERADLVVGSRFLDTDVDWHIPIARRIGINFFGWAVSLLIGKRATDTTSGFCGMNRRAIDVLATYLPQDYPDVESRVIVHKAGLRQIELPVHMRARMAGVSSINSWKSIYYAFKVSLAMITSALKDIHLQNHSPYVNGNSSANGIYQSGIDQNSNSLNGNHQNGAYQNGHSSNGSGTTTHSNGVTVPAISPNVVTPNGAEVVQPSSIDS